MHFQKYLGVFRDIDAYSATLTGAPLERRWKAIGRPHLRFLKIEDRVLVLERKVLILSILGLNLPFKM